MAAELKLAPRPPEPEPQTRAERNIAWCEKYLFLPEGKYVGQPFKMAEFMKDDFRAIYDNPHGTRRAIISRGRKNAKALALNTPIPTPGGWRTIGDIEPGDRVFGADGNPVEVLAVSEIFWKPCYAVGFSDGSSIVASADHLWTTRTKRHKSTLTTEQIASTLHVRRTDSSVEHRHKLDCAPALHTLPVPLPVPPYALGAWLGNGTAIAPNITVNQIDAEHFVEALAAEDAGDVRVKTNRNGASLIAITSGHGVRTGFRGRLRTTGLLSNKHIPPLYFDAGLAQRWALLQGLMDTDGTVNRHAGRTTPRCSYASSSYRLAYDVWRLARSLGLKAAISEGEAKIGDTSYGPCWRVSFAACASDPVFRLRRKQNLLPRQLGKRSGTIAITSCERVDTVPTKCLRVDARDHLFLAGHGCIPTHNSVECAAIALLHLCGPEYLPNGTLYSCAQALDQAAIIYRLMAKMARMSPVLRRVVEIKETYKEIHCPEVGTVYKALSADTKNAFGLSPVLTIHDELGQVRGPRYQQYEAMETATAAQDSPLTLIISTQAPTDADLLSLLIDDAKTGADPRTVLRLQSASMDDDPFAEATIRQANPAFDVFMNRDEVMAMAEAARRIPSREAEFRNLILNQRVEASNPFVAPSIWKACGEGPVHPLGNTTPVYAGLDLSSVADLTALVLIGQPVDRIWHVHPTFWLPAEGLTEKAHADRVPYDLWAKQGYLKTTPGPSITYEYVAHHLRELFNTHNIKKVAFDRWNMQHLKPWLERSGFSLQMIEDRFVEFGQGTKSMSPALRSLEEVLRSKGLAHGNHPVLTMCSACAVVEGKDDANRKLSKNRSSGRIDGLVALAMAVGVAQQMRPIDASTLIG